MKTIYIKGSICLLAICLATLVAKAQTKPSTKIAYNTGRHSSYDKTSTEQGRHVERIEMDWNDKTYKVELVDDKMTALLVDGEEIAAADWAKYSDAIAAIRKQIKENREQAIRNQEQARLNEIQAKRNQEQAGRN